MRNRVGLPGVSLLTVSFIATADTIEVKHADRFTPATGERARRDEDLRENDGLLRRVVLSESRDFR